MWTWTFPQIFPKRSEKKNGLTAVSTVSPFVIVVLETGLEPAHPCGYQSLKLACLPFHHSSGVFELWWLKIGFQGEEARPVEKTPDELVSPGNKSSRRAIRSFVEKAVESLFRGFHLLIFDPPVATGGRYPGATIKS